MVGTAKVKAASKGMSHASVIQTGMLQMKEAWDGETGLVEALRRPREIPTYICDSADAFPNRGGSWGPNDRALAAPITPELGIDSALCVERSK